VASREHSCTRREVLAGVAGVAAVPSPCRRLDGCPSPLEGEGVEREWEAAVAALRRAEEEIAAFKRVEPKGVSFAVQWALDEAFSDLVCAQNRAVERVLLAAAPDWEALAFKLGVAVDGQAWELEAGEAGMALLRADAERLCRADRGGASIRT